MDTGRKTSGANSSERLIGEARRLYLERLSRLPGYVAPVVSSVLLAEREGASAPVAEPKQRG